MLVESTDEKFHKIFHDIIKRRQDGLGYFMEIEKQFTATTGNRVFVGLHLGVSMYNHCHGCLSSPC